MFEFLRKFSIVNRVFAAVALSTVVFAVVGGLAYSRLQAHGAEIAALGKQARALGDSAAARELAASADALAAANATSSTLVGLVVVVFGVMGIASSFALRASIKYPVEGLVEAVMRMAKGDFVSKIDSPGRDEISWLSYELNTMRKRLRDSITVVRDAASSVRDASHQLAEGNADLSSRTETQASSLQQTAASMTQIAEKVMENATSARQATAIVGEATSMATRGGDVMKQVVARMGDINTSAQRIAEIIGVIDGIAFQTNILALNAAVEAARAGEAGRGFAVVAGEVRALAHRCATAAKEVKELIGDSVAKVEAGFTLVDEAGGTMQSILSGVNRVSELVMAIAQAGAAQGSDVAEVNQAIAQMNDMTQRNTTLVEDAARSAEALKTDADRMIDSVQAFKIAA